jgi:hypothetical protein
MTHALLFLQNMATQPPWKEYKKPKPMDNQEKKARNKINFYLLDTPIPKKFSKSTLTTQPSRNYWKESKIIQMLRLKSWPKLCLRPL